jgi:putative hydrolase of the HAD superfamily
VRAVLIDMLGTLVELRDPVPRLRAHLERRTGRDVGDEAAGRGFGAEISYYLEHHMEGADPESLDDLRDRCAQRMHDALGVEGLEMSDVRAAMMESLEFVPFPDARPALTVLRERGVRLVVVSNWDCSLPRWLEQAGLDELVDGTVSSAVVGRAKPAPDVFLEGLRLAGATPAEAVHVGDSLDGDVGGARAAGVRAILLQRHGEPPAGVPAIRTLDELPSLL